MTASAEVSRPVFLGVVVAAALAAVLLHEGTTSSFCAGLAAGAGLVFVLSFLKNPRNPPGGGLSEGEFRNHDQDSDRRG